MTVATSRPRRRPGLLDNARKAVADFGHTLALVRELRGLTGPQVEKMTDYSIDRSTLSRIESGKRVDPHLSTILVLCISYDMDVLITRQGRIETRGTNLSKLAIAKTERRQQAMSEVVEEGEVIGEEEAQEARNLPAVRAHEAMVTRAEITPEEVREQRDKVVQVMRTVMVRDQHYGVIPGVNKPTLLKPGAELLAVTFRLAPHYHSERIFHDDGHLTVVSRVTLVHIPSGLTIAEGEGLCTSREKKYAYRGGGRVCPECETAGTIKRSKYPPRENPEADPGWYCFAKVGGCGANFAYTDARIISQEEKPVPNPDLADTFNTVLKMGNKRALIAAILNGTAASDIFTQDMEDAAGSPLVVEPVVRREETAGRGAQIPRSWTEIKAALEQELGVEEAAVWGAQAKQSAESLPPPSLFQRMCGVVVDLLEQGEEWRLRPDAREAVQQVFAARLDGLVLQGPEWALTGAEAEAGTPSKDDVLKAKEG